MTPSLFCSWLIQLRQMLDQHQQRCLVVLKGDLVWSNSLIAPLFANKSLSKKPNDSAIQSKAIAFGAQFTADPSLIIGNYRHHLGTENDWVFFADNNFHPDAFAALSGTIKAGGVMVWLCSPELINDESNLFIQRLWQKIQDDKTTLVISPTDQTVPELNPLFTSLPPIIEHSVDVDCRTQEQLVAVKAIEKVFNGHRKRPLVLTADRGRGKSSALAIAVANLIKKPNQPQSNALSIVITAPHKDAVAVFFAQLANSCPNGTRSGDCFTYQTHIVQFMAVDVLVLTQPDVHLLLVDEAAAIPIYLLSNLLDRYHRLVFSSTVHGYEGAGRGFAINFKAELAKKCPQFAQLHIHQPIRWCENDPLEQLIFDSFLLAPINEISPEISADNVIANKGIVRQVSQGQLYENETLLQQVFSVLVTAHYQTSPSDLKFLLTNPQLIIFVSFANDNHTVLAVALTLTERHAADADIELALASKKRLKDQFLPQSLLLHCGIRTAFDYQYLRIVRIAVQPHLQGDGLGSALLTYVETYAKQQIFDFVGTSFGVNKPLINFWGNAGYQFARIGFTQDKASGEHSCLLLKSLSKPADSLLFAINQQFYQRFCYYLAEQFQHINPQLVQNVFRYTKSSVLPKLSTDDLNAVEDFINRVSLYDACAYSISVWLCNVLTETQTINAELLIAKVLQRRSASYICRQYQLTGKKALNSALISQVKTLYAS